MGNYNDEIGFACYIILALVLLAMLLMAGFIGYGDARDRCEVSYDNVRENVMEKNDYYVPPVNFDSIWNSADVD